MIMKRFIHLYKNNIRNLSNEALLNNSNNNNQSIISIPREMRKQLRSKNLDSSKKFDILKEKSNKKFIIGSVFVTLCTTGGLYYYKEYEDSEYMKRIQTILRNSFLNDIYKKLKIQIKEIARPFIEPSRDKLLPDWPMPGLGIPPNYPAPPTLILDLEDTLVHSEWDRRYGWRHAKRPGVDKFLETMSKYYEIVIFSKHVHGIAEPVVLSLDKKGYALHRLYRDSTRFINNEHIKDISSLNRNLKRAILIDDEPSAYQLQPENAIPIKPYVDGKDRFDTELTDLIPFLIALATENVSDFPALLNEFRNSDGTLTDLPSKYKARQRMQEMKRDQDRKKGLGGLLRNRKPSVTSNNNNNNNFATVKY